MKKQFILSGRRQSLWRTSFLLITAITCSFYSPITNAMEKTTMPAKPKISEPAKLSEEQEIELYWSISGDNENETIEKMKNIDPNYKFEKFQGFEGWPVINLIIRYNKIKLLEELVKRGLDTNLINIGTLKHIEDKESEIYKSLIKEVEENEKIKIANKLKIMKNEGYTTLYKDGSMAKTLDMCIIFDLPRQEEDAVTTSTNPNLAITNNLCFAIDNEEAIIVSQSLMSSLSLLSKQTKLKCYSGKDYKAIVNQLLCNNNWSIFVNTNNDLFVLIPHSKYPLIEKLADLKTIGLNPGMLTQKLNYTETISSENSQKIFDKLIGKKSIDKDIKSIFFDLPFRLKTMFLIAPTIPKIKNIRTLDVRIIMSGHGSEETSIYKKDWIAGFSLADTRSLRDMFENIGCSFVIVKTCFGGETMFMTQTLNFQRTQPETFHDPLSSKNFIEVVVGIPGSETYNCFDKPSQFFSDLNKFFENQKKSVIEKIKLKEKLGEEEVKYLSKNITEQQVLAGWELELPCSQKKTIHFVLPPLITRDKNIKKSTDFIKILRELIYPKANNIPRVRFPGDREMAPLIEVFPDLIQEAKELLNNILEEKKKDLKANKVLLFKFENNKIDLTKELIDMTNIEIRNIEKSLNEKNNELNIYKMALPLHENKKDENKINLTKELIDRTNTEIRNIESNLNEKNNELNIYKMALPLHENEKKKSKEMIPNLLKDEKKEPDRIDLLKQTINRLKIEIYDIGEYLKQLDRK